MHSRHWGTATKGFVNTGILVGQTRVPRGNSLVEQVFLGDELVLTPGHLYTETCLPILDTKNPRQTWIWFWSSHSEGHIFPFADSHGVLYLMPSWFPKYHPIFCPILGYEKEAGSPLAGTGGFCEFGHGCRKPSCTCLRQTSQLRPHQGAHHGHQDMGQF